jgi:hypothetical protein
MCICILAWVNAMQITSFHPRIRLSNMACLAVPYFTTLSHVRHRLRERIYWTLNLFRFPQQLLSVSFLILWRTEQNILINIRIHINYLLFYYILMIFEFTRKIFEKASNTTFHKNSPSVGAQNFHADRQTNTTKLLVTFHNFANAPIKINSFILFNTWVVLKTSFIDLCFSLVLSFWSYLPGTVPAPFRPKRVMSYTKSRTGDFKVH